MRFKAFISYKHATSSAFAADLELHLKRYAKAFWERPERLFRDEQYLKPGVDLPAMIRKALRDSEYLILLASPEAAASPWVQEEMQIWCEELNRADKLIVVLTKGKIGVDSHEKRIIWEETDALPPVLEKYLPKLPLYQDLSWAEEKEDRDQGNPTYRSAINAIVAALRDTTPNALSGLEWKIRRRNLSLAWSAVLLLSALLVVVIIGIFAIRRTNEDLRASIRLARSRELAAKSQLQPVPEAFLSAAEAVELDVNPESVFALFEVMSANQALEKCLFSFGESVEWMEYREREGEIWVLSEKGAFRVDPRTGTSRPLELQAEEVPFVLSGEPGKGWFGASRDRIIDLETGKNVLESESPLADMEWDPESGKILFGTAGGEVYSFSPENQSKTLLYSHRGMLTDLKVVGNKVISTALSREYPLAVFDLQKQILEIPEEAGIGGNAVGISPDGKMFGVAYELG